MKKIVLKNKQEIKISDDLFEQIKEAVSAQENLKWIYSGNEEGGDIIINTSAIAYIQ
jgi:hypothetical protein